MINHLYIRLKTFYLKKSLTSFMNSSRRSCLQHLESQAVERKTFLRNCSSRVFIFEFCRTAMEILNVVEKTYVPKLQDVVIDGVKIEPPKPLPFYPDRFAWQVNVPRLLIRKSPEFAEFHKFIVTETEAVGSINKD